MPAAVADEVIEAMGREEVDAVVDEAAEAMEQVEGEKEEVEVEVEAEAEADAIADDATEAMEQVEGDLEEADEAAEAMEQVDGELEEADEAAEAMEQVEGEQDEADAAANETTEAMEQVEGEREEADTIAESEASLRPALPLGRVKRIIRVDRDIKKVTSEAALLITAATELFLGFLASGAHSAASRRGRRTVRAVHVRAAARAHRPTADFLLDCLPAAEEAPPARTAAGSHGGGGREAKSLPRGTHRIDAFFQKAT